MRIYGKYALFVLAIVAVMGYSSCGPNGGPDTPVEEVQLAKLTGAWKMTGSATNVTLDGVNKKSDYTTFQLTISGTPGGTTFDYTTSGRPALSPWPSSGTWTFGADPETQIIRDAAKTADTLPMTYTVSDTQLELSFDFAKQGYSRTSNVSGRWVFTFSK